MAVEHRSGLHNLGPTRTGRDGGGAGSDDDGHVIYSVTEPGRGEVAAWFSTPVQRTQPPRDELAIKLALAVTVPGVDVDAVIQAQRSATMAALQDYTRLKRAAQAKQEEPAGMAWSLVLDSFVFAAEAEIRWLDHSEARLRRAARERQPSSAPAPASVDPKVRAR